MKLAKVTASLKPQLQVGKIDSSWVSRDPEIVSHPMLEKSHLWHIFSSSGQWLDELMPWRGVRRPAVAHNVGRYMYTDCAPGDATYYISNLMNDLG